MVRGLFTAYTGMLNQQYRLDTITNNLANAATTGYKREGATSRAFDDVLGVKIKDSSVSYVIQEIGKYIPARYLPEVVQIDSVKDYMLFGQMVLCTEELE